MRRFFPPILLGLTLVATAPASQAFAGRTKDERAARAGRAKAAARKTPPRRGSSRRARPSLAPARRGTLERPVGGVHNVAPPGETPLERDLQERLDALLETRWMKRAVNGVYVVDVASGRTLYSFGADRQLNPASNVKIMTTAAALDGLGGDFVFRTRLLGTPPDAGGVIQGDLVLAPSDDPTLRASHLHALAAQLRSSGVRSIAGDVVVLTTGNLRDSIGRSGIGITVAAGEKNGEAPTITLHPDSPLFTVESSARTVTRGRRPRTSVSVRAAGNPPAEKLVVAVSGRIRAGHVARFRRSVPRPALFTAHTLRGALLDVGIEVVGGARTAPAAPPDLVELAARESPPLGVIAARVNKPSSNFLADRVLWALGARVYGGDPTPGKGLRAVESYLARLGIVRGTYRLDNGSGLSYTNHLSPRQIVTVLLAAARDFRTGPDFLSSLSIGGRDGTLRGRFRGHANAGWVRGKTGTLSNVAALSGFVSAGGEDELCFSILTNNHHRRRRSSIRSAQGAMVDAMYRYLERRRVAATEAALPAALPPAVEESEPAPQLPERDDLSDGEAQDREEEGTE